MKIMSKQRKYKLSGIYVSGMVDIALKRLDVGFYCCASQEPSH